MTPNFIELSLQEFPKKDVISKPCNDMATVPVVKHSTEKHASLCENNALIR